MKKFASTTLGIYVLSFFPFLLAVISFFFLDIFGIIQTFKTIIMRPIYIPFLIVSILSFSIFLILYIRKIFIDKDNEYKNKTEALDKYIDERVDSLFMLTQYSKQKTNEQFQLFYNAILKLSNETIKVKKVNITEAEKALFDKLTKYEKHKMNEIYSLFNNSFSHNETHDKQS
ncbi:MAG TPA: hypothetical protein DDX39_05320 [Bacteroidales bacterium]|nr:MAG: hypothetical protein A2W98_10860 [Bacteroidetes bacterium GWF2_33_38]OFY73916.1 MAG: hypothetical protein A2265_08465 [Bacteroidetes bacterium RIFOXYA12_FULL_33_9]HBF88044.1 hypothetical protein [Bacteroidales bacterium]